MKRFHAKLAKDAEKPQSLEREILSAILCGLCVVKNRFHAELAKDAEEPQRKIEELLIKALV